MAITATEGKNSRTHINSYHVISLLYNYRIIIELQLYIIIFILLYRFISTSKKTSLRIIRSSFAASWDAWRRSYCQQAWHRRYPQLSVASRIFLVYARLGVFPLPEGLVCLAIAVDKSKFRTCELKPQIFRIFQNTDAKMQQIRKGIERRISVGFNCTKS